ncbi:MAG: TIGR00730 family Rossman fold protein [Bacteroidetes bacterium]|nr:TIGR00730 family Rossman fold protein [Bacteroidota bacterium]
MIKSVCVFCGSSAGSRESYKKAARNLGRLLAQQGITLIYGGSNLGLMTLIADEAMAHGGHVIGVMPTTLIDKEVAHSGLTEFIKVDSMSERKEVMMQMADAFIAMPGGVGTLDEIFEVMSWNQLGLMQKPMGLLNTDQFWNTLLSFLDHTVTEQFVRSEHRSNLIAEEDEFMLLKALEDYNPIEVDHESWISGLRSTM